MHPMPVPAERDSSMTFGLILHFGPAILFAAVVTATHFALLPLIIAYLVISFAGMLPLVWLEQRHPCVELPAATRQQIAAAMGLIFVEAVGIGTSVVLALRWLLQYLVVVPWNLSGWFGIAMATACTDLGYYWIHRGISHGKSSNPAMRWQRRKHAAHHTERPLDFFRGNYSSVYDAALTSFAVPLACSAALLHLDIASTLVSYGLVLMLQSTHHLNHTLNIGPLRFIFVDNHSHKLHHVPKGGARINQAAVFAFWDLLFGTYYENRQRSASYLAKFRIPI